MPHIQKFKSFEEARQAQLAEMLEKGFDPIATERFLEEFEGLNRNPYKRGVYRFKSFEEARAFDLQLRIRACVEQEYLRKKGK